jgi:NADPH-dependent 7-cyano-7-deazaguanine reductase QueF-like protein
MKKQVWCSEPDSAPYEGNKNIIKLKIFKLILNEYEHFKLKRWSDTNFHCAIQVQCNRVGITEHLKMTIYGQNMLC